MAEQTPIAAAEEGLTPEESVYHLLLERGLTVCTAESCTGGMLAARLINVPGVSEVFLSGYITYSNPAKEKILGVGREILETYGAVSRETAEAMARGAAAVSAADVAVAVTGIAGPGGGTEEKPVGLVYISCNVQGKIRVEKYNFHGSRAEIREASAVSALILMRECILQG